MSDFEYEYLKMVLKDNTVVVTFTKKNGDERVMTCTLQEGLLPERVIKEGAKPRKENKEVVNVYDLNAKGWRSFRVDSVKSVKPVEEE